MQIILKKQAVALGLKKYFTGKPCKQGHISERYVSGGACIECHIIYAKSISEKQSKYCKEWRIKNKSYTKQYYENNRNKKLSEDRIFYAENKELFYEKRKLWKENNPGRMSFLFNRWRIKNKKIMSAHIANYKSAKIMAVPLWADKNKIIDFYKNKPVGMAVDHIVPLRGRTVCGLHVENNLQYLTKEENSRKSNIWWPDMP